MIVSRSGLRLIVLNVVRSVRLVMIFGRVIGSSSSSDIVFLLKKVLCYRVFVVSVLSIKVMVVDRVVILSDSVIVCRMLLCLVVLLN